MCKNRNNSLIKNNKSEIIISQIKNLKYNFVINILRKIIFKKEEMNLYHNIIK